MNASGILVYKISDCLQTAAQTGLIELEERERFSSQRTEFGRNFVRTYSNMSALALQ